MKTNKELIDSIHSIIKSDILSGNIVNLLYSVIGKIYQNDNLIENLENQQNRFCKTLKSMVGRNIYWASPNWRHEKHVITDVKYDIYDSDFFDTADRKFKGKKCIIIEVDNDGNYLADDIGRTLFFDEEEAISHSKYGCKKQE